MTRDKENLARAEEEVKQLKERLISLKEELQKANIKLTVFDKVRSTAENYLKQPVSALSFIIRKMVSV